MLSGSLLNVMEGGGENIKRGLFGLITWYTAKHTTTTMETFLILAKQTNGEASVQLIRDCLESPGIYRFSELLYLPNIAEVLSP